MIKQCAEAFGSSLSDGSVVSEAWTEIEQTAVWVSGQVERSARGRCKVLLTLRVFRGTEDERLSLNQPWRTETEKVTAPSPTKKI